MPTPIDNINDGYEFQRVVAEYFRCLKQEKHEYQILDVHVEDFGVGPDDGCDILVDFWFEDAIDRYRKRWLIECKSQTKAIGSRDINIDNVETLLKINDADGYLLVCKSDATSSVKRIFKNLNGKSDSKFNIWNGSQLWHKLSARENFIKAFFPKFYRERFIDSGDKENFNDIYEQLEQKLKK